MIDFIQTKLYLRFMIFLSTALLLFLSVSSIFTINIYYHIFGILLFIIGYFRPIINLYILLVMLGLFGDRPCGLQSNYLVVYLSYSLLGVYTNLIKNRYLFKKFLSKIRLNNIFIFFVYLYIIISFLSLIGLPLLKIIQKIINGEGFYIVKNILSVGEATLLSSVQSVLLLFQAFLVGLYVYGAIFKDKLIIYRNLLLAILVGLLFSIIIGHLDFFGIYDISWYREIDGNIYNRFHSFFINSSWYSQYLALILPFLSILILFFENKKIALTLLIILMILGEVTLILSMQRGAWITYPSTLFIIWINIYYAFAKTRDKTINLNIFIRKNWLKIVLTTPLTIVMSLYIVYATKDYRKVNNISVTNTFINVISRAKEVTKTTDRLRYWSPAIKLWLENPIFGGGGDSFGWQYKIYYYQKNAKYKGDKSDTLKISESGTAHNLYLQTLVGKGIFGLISLLGVIFIAIFGLIKKELISQKSQTIEGLVISLSILGSLFATLIYANVQEIFYIQSISVIFWLVVFIGASISFEHSNKKFRKKFNKIFLYISIFMLLLLPFHIFNISYVKEYSVDYFNSISLP